MDLYIVKGKAFAGVYSESVELLDGMEEKPKSFVGLGKKINKSKIDKIEMGLTYGSYQIILIDKEKINEARKLIKEEVYEYNMKNLKSYQESVEAINNHDFSKEIEINNY